MAGVTDTVFRRFIRNLGGCGLILGIYGRTKDKAAHLAKEFEIPKVYDTYEQMLADKEIDVVDLVVANYMHIPLAIQAAQAGKHVFC